MVFEWLHLPSENGYNRRRHLAATPPDFWSPHDKYYGKWERSKYFRALHKEFRRYGGPTMAPQAAHRRFRAKWPGGPGTYFPYASALTPAGSHLFRDEVNFRRHHYRFMDELWDGLYGDPVQLLRWADFHDVPIDVLMDLAEIDTQIPVEGPRGYAHWGARENAVSLFEENDPHPFGVPSRI